jgi:hypothetical protein
MANQNKLAQDALWRSIKNPDDLLRIALLALSSPLILFFWIAAMFARSTTTLGGDPSTASSRVLGWIITVILIGQIWATLIALLQRKRHWVERYIIACVTLEILVLIILTLKNV